MPLSLAVSAVKQAPINVNVNTKFAQLNRQEDAAGVWVCLNACNCSLLLALAAGSSRTWKAGAASAAAGPNSVSSPAQV